MIINITEDYQDNLKEIAKYVGLKENQINVLSNENGEEWICNNKGDKIKPLNERFWSWFDNGCEEITAIDGKFLTKYAKVHFDDTKDLRNKNIYKLVKTHDASDEYMELAYTEIEKEKTLIGESFHWSEICGTNEPIVEFYEEENFWLK